MPTWRARGLCARARSLRSPGGSARFADAPPLRLLPAQPDPRHRRVPPLRGGHVAWEPSVPRFQDRVPARRAGGVPAPGCRRPGLQPLPPRVPGPDRPARGACAAAAVAVFVVPFLILGPDGFWGSIHRQAGRPLQIESLGAGILLVAHQIGGLHLDVVTTHGSQNLAGTLPDALAAAESALLV